MARSLCYVGTMLRIIRLFLALKMVFKLSRPLGKQPHRALDFDSKPEAFLEAISTSRKTGPKAGSEV